MWSANGVCVRVLVCLFLAACGFLFASVFLFFCEIVEQSCAAGCLARSSVGDGARYGMCFLFHEPQALASHQPPAFLAAAAEAHIKPIKDMADILLKKKKPAAPTVQDVGL
jgi:hypothetical protein